MSGVYYRHEFARRNDEIVKASNDLMEFFPLTQEIRNSQSEYTINNDSETITSRMIEEFRDAPRGKNVQMKGALRGFLQKYRIMPVPPLKLGHLHPGAGTFLLYPCKLPKDGDEKIVPSLQKISTSIGSLFVEYARVVEFEEFAVSDLGFGESIFMPIVPLRKNNPKIGEAFGKPNILKADDALLRYRLQLVDFNQPADTLRNHFEMQRMRHAFSVPFKTPKIVRENLRQIHWDKLDGYLGVLDWERKRAPAVKRWDAGSEVLPNYILKLDWDEKEKLRGDEQTSEKFYKWVRETYGSWLSIGEEWVTDYKLII